MKHNPYFIYEVYKVNVALENLEILEIIAYVGAVLIGFTIGLTGSGGSILTIPTMVYLLGIDPVLATAYSLFVVGVCSTVGALSYMRKGLTSYRTALIFAVPSLLTVFLTRKYLIPALPDTLFTIAGHKFSTDVLFLLVITLSLVGTAFLLLRFNLNQTGKNNFTKVILLMIPAAFTVFTVRQFVIPNLPEEWLTMGKFTITKGKGIMFLFVVIMLISGISMLRGKKKKVTADQQDNFNYALILFQGLAVGLVTGIVGAGGGFLIIPALVMFARLPMKLAIGTSLLIVAVQAQIGFVGDIANRVIDWGLLLSFTGIALTGIFVGVYASKFISGEQLKKGFAIFVLCMAVVIVIKELQVF